MKWLVRNKDLNIEPDKKQKFQPKVLVLLPVYNEEKSIYKTLEYLNLSEYPKSHFQIVVGSDCSTDATDRLVQHFAANNTNVSFKRMAQRSGKPNVLNHLVRYYSKGYDILLFMDAGALIHQEAISQLVKNFSQKEIGIVAANFRYKPDPNNIGVAHQEKIYIDRENEIKQMESIAWGSVMGVFGACYAVRKSLFKPFPSKFLVDDFYITMHVLQQGYQAIHETKALVLDFNNSTMQNEFRRKVRISMGNYQNLAEFNQLLWRRGWGVGFSFLSHKVLRWLGPFFILAMLITCVLLANHFVLFQYIALVQFVLLSLPLLDIALSYFGIYIKWIRSISYFYSMNVALLVGFFKYLGGVKNSTWEPEAR